MSKKKAYITILLFVGLLVGELHQFFKWLPYREANLFIDAPTNLPSIRWWLKDIGSMVQRLIWVYSFFLAAKMIDVRLSSIISIFVIYCFLDIILYVICYQMYGYSVVYGIMGLFTFLILTKR